MLKGIFCYLQNYVNVIRGFSILMTSASRLVLPGIRSYLAERLSILRSFIEKGFRRTLLALRNEIED